MKIKLITGYRRDQTYSVDAEEAHKAYFLFNNPNARTVFKDGLALKGSEIEIIEPDYQGTMGWNPTHVLDADDMNEIRSEGIDRALRRIMSVASDLAKIASPEDLQLTLSEAIKKYPQLGSRSESRGGGMKRIGTS